MYETLQFPVPNIETVFGQRNRRLRSNFRRNEQVIEPDENAGVIGGHVDESEDEARGIWQPAIVDQSPGRQVYAGGDAEAQGNPENLPGPGEVEIGGEKKNRYQDSAFDEIRGLLQEVSSGDDAKELAFGGIGRRQSGCKNQDDSSPADKNFS